MRVLILWADGVSANLGVRVLGAGASALAARAFPGAETTFLNYGLDTAPMRVGSWRALLRESVTNERGLRRWLSAFDLVVDTRSGDSFTDIYGISRLVTMNLVAGLVRSVGVPLVMAPQTLGPFQDPRGRWLGSHALRGASAVLVRDSISLDFGRALGARPTKTSDLVFALPAPEPSAHHDVLLNVSGLLWNDNPHVPWEHYRAVVTGIARSLLAQGRAVSLLAHVLDNPTSDNDVPAVRELSDLLGGSVKVIIPADLDELRGLVAGARLVIGSRMHACLNAISCGTPAIPLAYSRKFAPLLADLGWSALIDLNSTPDPVARTLEIAADPELPRLAAQAKKLGSEDLGVAVQILRDCVRDRATSTGKSRLAPCGAAASAVSPQPGAGHAEAGPIANVEPSLAARSMATTKRKAKTLWMSTLATWRTLRAFQYDYERYLAHSSTLGAHGTKENLAAKITERYHTIEKGLSLPNPRPAFGASVISVLINLVESYVSRFGQDSVTASGAGALSDYLAFNLAEGVPLGAIPESARIVRLLEQVTASTPGTSGRLKITRQQILDAVAPVGLEFFTSRHSTRVFDPAPVTPAEIDYALLAARSAPAVCNREFSAAAFWTDRARIQEILQVQGGARGFGDQIPALAMVTISLRTYWSEAERNQGWIDGGLFAMNLILGLHAQGLGTVPLNWSKGPTIDRTMRSLVQLPDDRSIVMFIGFGHLAESYTVAASPRRAPSDFILPLA